MLVRAEGRVDHMYLDTKGLVTVGVGFLLSTLDSAIRLNFQRDGRKATEEEIAIDYGTVKIQSKGMMANYYKRFTHCYLSDEEIDLLLDERK